MKFYAPSARMRTAARRICFLSPRHIAAEELRDAFSDKPPQEFARIIETLEAKYDCKDRMLCYVVCYFTPKGKEGMRADFGV